MLGNDKERMGTMLSVEDVAKILNVSKKSVYKFVNQGKLKAYKIGVYFRFQIKDVEEFIRDSEIKKDQDWEIVDN